jgi:tripartite-type tricarboxylate transporter receptor subunit TctC
VDSTSPRRRCCCTSVSRQSCGALMVTAGRNRLSVQPDVLTATEQGVPSYAFVLVCGVWSQRHTVEADPSVGGDQTGVR